MSLICCESPERLHSRWLVLRLHLSDLLVYLMSMSPPNEVSTAILTTKVTTKWPPNRRWRHGSCRFWRSGRLEKPQVRHISAALWIGKICSKTVSDSLITRRLQAQILFPRLKLIQFRICRSPELFSYLAPKTAPGCKWGGEYSRKFILWKGSRDVIQDFSRI